MEETTAEEQAAEAPQAVTCTGGVRIRLAGGIPPHLAARIPPLPPVPEADAEGAGDER